MRQIIATDAAPAAIGPYSQAVLVDGWLWCSGQIPLDPTTMELVHQGADEASARAQTRQVLDNLRAVLEAGGCGFGDVVKCGVFVADMGHFGAINEEYTKYFGTDAPPARATVEVRRLPKDVAVEIDCVAHVSK
jgi:2-iminobutanoate/2-iminopropanoate deaminase